jgi:arylsulfatase A
MGKDAVASDAGTVPRLYNLDQEIGERTNLAAAHPEIVARLQALAEKITAEIGGTTPTARRPAGEVAAPRTLYPSEANGARAKKAKKAGE